MKKEELLKQLRDRQQRKVDEGLFRELHPEIPDEYWIDFIGKMSLKDLIDSYLRCPDCGEFALPIDRAIDLIKVSRDSDEWLDRVHGR